MTKVSSINFPIWELVSFMIRKALVEELKKFAKRILPSPTVEWHGNKNKINFEEPFFFAKVSLWENSKTLHELTS